MGRATIHSHSRTTPTLRIRAYTTAPQTSRYSGFGCSLPASRTAYIADTPKRHRFTMQEIVSKLVPRRLAPVVLAIAIACTLSGCSHFHPHPSDNYVYVTAKQTFLRDRVAAVSNRTGSTSN